MFVKDEQHRWILLNDAYCRFMGYERAELLGKSDYDFFPRAEAEVFWSKDDLVFATGAVDENEERFTDATGRVHVILTRKSLHVDETGRRLLVGVITDITDRKEMERDLRRSRDELERRVAERTTELQQANAQLQEQDRRKNEFLGVLSHELRNPLAPMMNALYVLDKAPHSDERASAARAVIGRQLDHLARLVDDLLDVTRISHGKINLQRARVDLADTVRRTVDDHRPLFASRHIELELEERARPLIVYADRTRLTQILGNLLQNAVKFTNSGGHVRISLERSSAGDAVLRVLDDGIGLPRDMLPRLFQPFTQADESLHRSTGGLGLGLALVKGLTELHGGTVDARSEGPGRGAEFTLRLPSAAPDDRALEPRSFAPAPRRRRVAVIEDNLDAADTLRLVLELAGHEVTVAYDGRDGMEKIRAFHPDLVLCDIGLPEMDGYAVARAIRADPALAATELVAVSGYALPDDLRKAREAGFDRHLAKPVPLAQLDEVLRDQGVARAATGPVLQHGDASRP